MLGRLGVEAGIRFEGWKIIVIFVGYFIWFDSSTDLVWCKKRFRSGVVRVWIGGRCRMMGSKLIIMIKL